MFTINVFFLLIFFCRTKVNFLRKREKTIPNEGKPLTELTMTFLHNLLTAFSLIFNTFNRFFLTSKYLLFSFAISLHLLQGVHNAPYKHTNHTFPILSNSYREFQVNLEQRLHCRLLVVFLSTSA